MLHAWDDTQAWAVLGAMKAVGRRGSGTDDGPRRLVAAAAQHLFEVHGSVDGIAEVTPAELADAVTDEDQRRLAVETLVLVPYADTSVDEHEVATVDEYATALGTSTQTLKDLHQVRKGHIKRLMVDYARRADSNVRTKADADAGHGILRRTFDEVHQYVGDPKVTARYLPLAEYEPGTLGRTFFDFYRARGFPLPGEKKSLGEAVVSHDCCHILSGFNTDGSGEIDVAGFEAGMKRDDFGYELVLEVLLDFQLGVDFGVGLVGYVPKTGELDPDQLMVGIRRGLDCTVDLMGPQWDFWEAADQQVVDLRERYGITGVEGVQIPPPARPATAADPT